MITIYKETHILEKDHKLYIFLKQKNLMTQFLRGLNGVHNRETQYHYWTSKLDHPQNSFSAFSWRQYGDTYPEDKLDMMKWYEYYLEFSDMYSSLSENITLKLIKVV